MKKKTGSREIVPFNSNLGYVNIGVGCTSVCACVCVCEHMS